METPKHPNTQAPNETTAVNDGNGEREKPWDLEERTAQFGEAVIDLLRNVPKGPLTNRLISQLVGCSTSVGANYCEADEAVSRRDYKYRIGFCKKEAREAKHFLRMIARASPNHRAAARVLWQEAKELHLIFSAMYRKTKVDDDEPPVH
jgi:four helix bundle protein